MSKKISIKQNDINTPNIICNRRCVLLQLIKLRVCGLKFLKLELYIVLSSQSFKYFIKKKKNISIKCVYRNMYY